MTVDNTNELSRSPSYDAGVLYQGLFSQNALGVAKICSLTGRFVAVNERYASMVGLTVQEMMEIDFHRITVAEDLQVDLDKMASLKSGELDTYQLDKRYRHRNGSEVWVRLTVLPLWPKGAEPDYHLAIVEDVSSRVVSERSLRESRRRLQTLMDTLPGMAYRCLNDQNWTMEFVSGGAEDLTGYRADEIAGNRVVAYADLIVPEDRDAVWEEVQRCLGERDSFRLDYRIRRCDGTIAHVWEKGIGIYDEAGELVCLEGFVTSVTERVEAEAERAQLHGRLLHAQKLESLGLLAGGIAHDFNNLLGVVLGYADLATRETAPDSEVAAMLREIIRGGRRAAALTEQMLAYAGKAKFREDVICLTSVVEEMGSLLRASISKKCDLHLHLPKNAPRTVGDAGQIRQVVMNLIINASEALPDTGGVVTVEIASTEVAAGQVRDCVTREALAPGNYLLLQVTDTGSGMGPETLTRVFDPFYSTKFTGRGLGLAVVHGIVRSHEGAITVASGVGEGTCFSVYLPKVERVGQDRSAEQHGRKTTDTVDDDGDGVVLLVDDEEMIRTLATRILERWGYRVESAVDGVEALAKFCNQPDRYRLIFLDMTMPRMDGAEVARRIREQSPQVPILLASGYTDRDAAAKLLPSAPAAFIPKPYGPNDVRDALGKLLAKG